MSYFPMAGAFGAWNAEPEPEAPTAVRVEWRQLRGYWLTDLGQRVSAWVPAGVFTRGAAADIDGASVVALVGSNGWAWHVAAALADKLPAA